jgi:cytoskeletal protein RodZ
MTSNRQPRRLSRQVWAESASGEDDAVKLPISERLRAAREARGADLFRVERDTKIRMKYLTAMEQGNFTELPADVYARGFLRNYASYLGLDPDEAESEWRRGNFVSTVKAPPVGAAPVVVPPVAVRPLKLPAVKMPQAKAAIPPVQDAAAPAFKRPGFRLPGVKWPAGQPADAAAAAAGPAFATPQPASAEPSIVELESPVSKRLSFSPSMPAFLHRWEKRGAAEPLLGGPQPIAMPGRSLVLQPIHIVLLLLAVVIVAVLLFFSNQAQRVLQNPTLSVTTPVGALQTVPTGTTSYTLEGKATPKAEINISWDLRDPMHAQANASGNWSYKASLHNGNNQFDIWSTDLNTNHDSATVTRIINVPTPTASPVASFLSVDSPLDGQGFTSGIITVTGTTVAITSVTVTATYVGPAPSSLPTPKPVKTGPIPTAQATIVPLPTAAPLASPTATPKPTPAASNSPAPVQALITINGNFTATLHLWSGRWKLSVVGITVDGIATAPVVRNVIVTAGSLTVLLQIRGGDTVIKIWQDGKVMRSYNNIVVHNGANITIVANQSVWFYANWPNHVLATVNGVSFGRLTTGHTVTSWRITAFGAPTPSNDR